MNADRLVYVAGKRRVAAIDAATGDTVWNTRLEAGFWGASQFVTLARDGESIFAVEGKRVHGLDALTGRVEWTTEVTGLGGVPIVLAGPSSSGNTAAALASAVQNQQVASAGVIAGGAAGGAATI